MPVHKVKRIGIDEFAIRKGHSCMTVVTDLATGRILYAVEGRKKEDIRPFLQKLSKKAKKLQAVAMDMSGSYYWACQNCLTSIEINFYQ